MSVINTRDSTEVSHIPAAVLRSRILPFLEHQFGTPGVLIRQRSCKKCKRRFCTAELLLDDLRDWALPDDPFDDPLTLLQERARGDKSSRQAVSHMMLPADRRGVGDWLWLIAVICAASDWNMYDLILETLVRKQ